MKDSDLEAMENRARSAQEYARSKLDAGSAVWEPDIEGSGAATPFTCPLCDGEGEVEGVRFDHKTRAATVVAYGIGEGLGMAEEWVSCGPQDVLDLVAEVRRLKSLQVPDRCV